MDMQTLLYVLDLSMNNKTLGIIIIVFGGLVLYSEQELAWIISSISIGIGSGIFFWKDKKNDIDT
jgi:hypothetical protein